MSTVEHPDWLMGRKFESEEEVVEAARRLLSPSHKHYRQHAGLCFENAPEILVTTGGGPVYQMTLYLPLPNLDASEYTCDEVEEMLALCIPAHTKLEVKIHPGPDEL